MPSTHTPHEGQLDHGWGWLRPTEPAAVQPISPRLVDDGETPEGSEWQWLTAGAGPHPPAIESPNRLWRRWIWLATAVVLGVVSVGVWVGVTAGHQDTPTALPTVTAAPPIVTTSPTGGACAGLSGATVTDSAGDTRSVTGVIAAFEHAYYVARDAAAALALVGQEAGLVAEALAAGIASISPGTTHCVAITPITGGAAAEVHLVERHPDGGRRDYLQLINTRLDEHGTTVITNIQKRG
ncbi:hypothetical protein [Nocardia suismassiliense]|uniref:hypothetical protein n=1 Tax=Nocardia suismassiliense TaxID=2077092 RepID=UPI000D1FC88D|nr:hypothetical protein [Nocardia suismassiliense]